MLAFHQSLQQRRDKASALRQAMLQTRARYPVPMAWAAFVLFGEAE
jgi:CHAT domain-containing protein